jgi:broad specificity phosphatase PhoE
MTIELLRFGFLFGTNLFVLIWAVSGFSATSSCFAASRGSDRSKNPVEKQITFVRHGCTYMNEYLGGADGGTGFGLPNFTDVMQSPDRLAKYQDSPLSPLGRRQARNLLLSRSSSWDRPSFVENCELVVVSPLTRALQTLHLGLRPHLPDGIPVVALPTAAERLYLISDVGRAITELREDFPYVDFESGFDGHDRDKWWFQASENYQEWRPIGQGQRYACPGEPQADFDARMARFHSWLEDRPETHISVVCHHGVIDWMLGMDFDNCQYEQVPFSQIQPEALLRIR